MQPLFISHPAASQSLLDLLEQPRFQLVLKRGILRCRVVPLGAAMPVVHGVLNLADDLHLDAAVGFIPQADIVFVSGRLRYSQGDHPSSQSQKTSRSRRDCGNLEAGQHCLLLTLQKAHLTFVRLRISFFSCLQISPPCRS
jgi:hypothetical protein